MTTKYQKKREIMFAKETGKLLGESWDIKSSPDEENCPDLIVAAELGKFGLEVREIYLDESKKGSTKKANEKNNQKKIKKLADDYYKTTCSPIPVKVKLLGDLNCHNQLLNTITREVKQLSPLEQKKIELHNGCSIYITRLPEHFEEYKRWDYVTDMTGWVGYINKDLIQKIIAEKAQNIPKYTREIPDIRLLLVSDRVFNSGKARLASNTICDACGFTNVYYLSYPEEACKIAG